MTILNLGCGNKPAVGAINHDRTQHAPFVDVSHDLNVYPWPWPDNCFDVILAMDVLEHLDSFISFFNECWRIMQPSGIVTVQTPRWDSVNVAIDPTHRRGYHPESFDYLDPNTGWGSKYPMYTDRKWTKIGVFQDDGNLMAKLQVVKPQVQL